MTETVENPPQTSAIAPPLSLNDLQGLSLEKLASRGSELGMRTRVEASRHHMVLDQARYHLSQGGVVHATGFLELTADHGILRWPAFSLKPGADDVHVPAALLRPLDLRPGLMLRCDLRLPQERERGLVAESILEVEGIPLSQWETPPEFDKLTPLFPDRRIFLEAAQDPSISARAVDLIAPLGMGQRGLIVAPPRAGKTLMLKALASAIRTNHPEIVLMLLLVDERPEEVTDLRRDLDCEIYSSTFDEQVTRHVQVCEAVSERAKRLVELRKDVVILLDSITRMARGYNNLQPNKGRIMSGGVDSKALARPRKFFGSARNVEEGGSLTIVATALVETQSRMEVHLDRSIAEQRIFPAIHIVKSGTRREELLYHPEEYERIVILRRQLSELPAAEAMEVLATNLQHTKSNAELLLTGLRGL
jgi:transcription termination factor Rho